MIATSVERCLFAKVWHAFHALAKEESTLDYPKALVFTQTLVSALHLPQTVMVDFKARFEPGEVSFQDFQKLISAHLLEKLKLENDMVMTMVENDAESDEEEAEKPRVRTTSCAQLLSDSDSRFVLDDLCWTLFSKQGLPADLISRLSLELLHQLWQWFIAFADTDQKGVVLCPVGMDGYELDFWLQFLISDLLALEFTPRDFQLSRFSFEEATRAILSAVEDMRLTQSEMEHVLKEFHEEVVCCLIRKGILLKKTFIRNTNAGFADIPSFLLRGTSEKGYLKEGKRKRPWKRRHCVLTMSGLTIFSERGRRTRCANIPVSKMIATEAHREEGDLTYFQLEAEGAMFVFKAEDLRSRNRWIRDIRFVMDSNEQKIDNIHFLKAETRKEEFARRREERAQREHLEQWNETLARTNERLHSQLQNLQYRVADVEKDKMQERDRLLQVQVMEAKLHCVTESTKETMDRLQKEILEKSQELDASRRKELESLEQQRQLHATSKQQQQKIAQLTVRNKELDARVKELLAKIHQLEKEDLSNPKAVCGPSHRGQGAFPMETFPK